MVRRPVLVALAMSLAASAGCSWRSTPAASPVVHITCSWPDYGPEAIDASVAMPVAIHMIVLDNAQRVNRISTYGRTDLYVIGRQGTNAAAFLASVRRSASTVRQKLPAGVIVAAVRLLSPGQAAPTRKPKLVDTVKIVLKPDELAAAGVPVKEVRDLIRQAGAKPATQQTVTRLAALSVPVKAGPLMTLGDVATITVDKEPDCVTGTYP